MSDDSDRADALQATVDRYEEVLADPAAVHVNMLRGTIARMSREQILHLHPEIWREIEDLQTALRVADDSISHHLRNDRISAALIQPHAVKAIREALANAKGNGAA